MNRSTCLVKRSGTPQVVTSPGEYKTELCLRVDEEPPCLETKSVQWSSKSDQRLELLQRYVPKSMAQLIRSFEMEVWWYSYSDEIIQFRDPEKLTWPWECSSGSLFEHTCGSEIFWRDKFWVVGAISRPNWCQVESYDFETKSWTKHAPMAYPRAPLLVSYQNFLFALNGTYAHNGGMYRMLALECYDAVTDTWRKKTDPPPSIDSTVAAVYGSYIYVLSNPANVQRYDIKRDVWEPVITNTTETSEVYRQYRLSDGLWLLWFKDERPRVFDFSLHQWSDFTLAPLPPCRLSNPWEIVANTSGVYLLQMTWDPLVCFQYRFSHKVWEPVKPIGLPIGRIRFHAVTQ
jgi:hypothetical protein